MSVRELITEHLDLWTGAVTKKSSSGRGSNGKVELTGVKKLRELILELAIKGKLVNQNPNAEPAHVLLARLRGERLELEKNKKVKKRRKANESVNLDELNNLPNNWCWSQLGEVAFKLTDGSHNPPKDAGRGIPMLSSQNVNLGRIDFKCPSRYLTIEDFVKEDARTEARPGDVLLTIVASLGRAAVVPPEAPQFALQRSVAVIGTPIDSEFLAYQLIAPNCLNYYDTHGKGTAQKGIYLGKLAVMPIAVPPLEEQHRIVQKVDELMTLCDRLEQQTSDQLEAHETLVDTLLGTLTQSENATELTDNWARLAAHFDTLFTTEQSIDKLKQTILELAVRGKLVDQNPDDKPAQQFLELCLNAKSIAVQQGELKKARKHMAITDEYAPFKLPEGWLWARLDDLVRVINGRAYKKHEMLSSGTPLLRVGNLFTSNEWYYSDLELEDEKYIDNGDLIYAWSASFGPYIWEGGRAIYHYHIWKLDLFDAKAISKHFLYLYLKTITEEIKSSGSGIAMVHMTKTKMEELVFPFPPLEEQHRIVQKVDELMALCDRLKERLNEASETRSQLAEAVVENARN